MRDEIDEALKDINFDDDGDNFGLDAMESSKKEEEKQGGTMEVEEERLFGMMNEEISKPIIAAVNPRSSVR